MLGFLKENGFPMTLYVETGDHEEVLDDDSVWKGYESIVTNENNKEVARFFHNTLFSRYHWINGFFEGLKHNINE